MLFTGLCWIAVGVAIIYVAKALKQMAEIQRYHIGMDPAAPEGDYTAREGCPICGRSDPHVCDEDGRIVTVTEDYIKIDRTDYPDNKEPRPFDQCRSTSFIPIQHTMDDVLDEGEGYDVGDG